MKKCNVWAVAAAYLLEGSERYKERCEDYRKITKFILETEITTLGEKGHTPEQTVEVILRDKKIDGVNVFASIEEGRYYLEDVDSMKENLEVLYALERLKNAGKM